MTDWGTCPVIESVPDRLSGAWVFTDTRLPVSALFENLESGATVEEFLEWFEGAEEWESQGCVAACGRFPEGSRAREQS